MPYFLHCSHSIKLSNAYDISVGWDRHGKEIIRYYRIIDSLGSISGTLYYTKNHNTSSMIQQKGGTPTSMPNQGENSQNNESNQQDSSQNNQSSNAQSNSKNQDSNDQTNESSNGQAPNNQQSVPGQNNSQPGQINQEMTSVSQSLNALQIVIISISVLVFMLAITYLIMSKFGSNTLAETFYGAKPTAIYAVVNVVGTILLVCALVLSSNALLFNNASSNNTSQISTEGVVDISNSRELSNKTLSSTSSDESTIVVNDGGSLNASSLIISKSGDSSNTENSEFYGLNAAVLVQKGSEATIKDTTIKTNASGANAIFATGENAVINVSNKKITTTWDSSRGLDATYGGTINANKVIITTSGQHCAAVATDRGEGTGTFSAIDSTLTISKKSKVYGTSPMFFITNTDAVINLENTNLNYGSNPVSGNDGEWGSQGSNGGNLTFNATNQTLNGNISVDNISTASFILKGSTLTSTINSENNAKEVNLSLDSSSKWIVTGNSYVTTLTLENNDLSLIEDHGYTIYYDASANSWLNGQIITLSNGGTLTPIQ